MPRLAMVLSKHPQDIWNGNLGTCFPRGKEAQVKGENNSQIFTI